MGVPWMGPGYYLPQYNFSVRYHNGQWCLFARQPEDVIATTSEQIQAVKIWAATNRDKFNRIP